MDGVLCCPVNIAGHGPLPPVTPPLPLELMEVDSYEIQENNPCDTLKKDSMNSNALPSSPFKSNSQNLGQCIIPSSNTSALNNINGNESISESSSIGSQTLEKITSASVSLKRLEDKLPYEGKEASPMSNSDDSSSSSKKFRGSFVCSEEGCGKIFKRPDRLQQHMRIHTGARPFVCDVTGCGRSYTRSQHLARHKIVSHSNSTEEKEKSSVVRCNECNKDYSSVYSLRKHLAQFHARRKHSCPECGQLFLKQQHLSSHLQSHTGQLAYRCEFPGCKKAFAVPSKLKLHSKVHQAGRYRCTRSTECTRTFDRYVDLRQHVSVEHPYICPVCGVQFPQLSRYNRHRATHEDLRLTYHCTKAGCGRCYYSLRALTSHVRDKHDGEAQLHQCPICDKSLSTKQKLQQHMNTHSLDYTPQRRVSPNLLRKKRCDKGISRTDYRRLLSGYFTHDGTLSRRARSQSPTSEHKRNKSEGVYGTRRFLEASAFERERLSHQHPSAERDARREGNDVPPKDSLNLMPRPQGFHSNEQLNAVVEGEKIGDVFISGEGAIKESRVLLTKLSDEVVQLFDTCHLKEN